MKHINIIIAGYGVFGSRLVEYLTRKHKNIKIIAIIEPNRHKRDMLKKLKVATYEHILDIPNPIMSKVAVIVDCSPRGQGIKNKALYEELNIPAIFQNGEETAGIGKIYYPLLTDIKDTKYLKIPLCSGIAVIKVLDALRQQNIPLPSSVSALHTKVTNTARMLTPMYQDSIQQIKELTNIDANMDVIYLRGEPYNSKFTYYGSISLQYAIKAPKLDKVVSALEKYPTMRFESQELDLLTLHKTLDEKTVIIKDSLRVHNNTVSLLNMSDTPGVNFPIVVEAIKELANNG